MSNIVPKENEIGQLGRDGRRWAAVHASLAVLDSVQFVGSAEQSPGDNVLWRTTGGALMFGSQSVTLGGSTDQINESLQLLLNEQGDGLNPTLDYISENFDTIKEIADFLVAQQALNANLDTKYTALDDALTAHVVANAASFTAVNTRITDAETSISAQTHAYPVLSGATSNNLVKVSSEGVVSRTNVAVSNFEITAPLHVLGTTHTPFGSVALGPGVENPNTLQLSSVAGVASVTNYDGSETHPVALLKESNLSQSLVYHDGENGLKQAGIEVAISGDSVEAILPTVPGAVNLGADNARFNKIFAVDLNVTNNSVYIGDTKLSASTLSGELLVNDAPVALTSELTSVTDALDTKLTGAIAAEATDRASAITALSLSVSGEVSRLDTEIANVISGAIDISDQLSTLSASLTSDFNTAISAATLTLNQNIASAISDEVTARDTAINTAISGEAIARANAINAATLTLNAEISSQVSGLSDAFSASFTALSGELSALETSAADDLSAAISQEVTDRDAAISTAISAATLALRTDLASEVSLLNASISAEEIARTTDVSTLTTRIAAEETKREQEDNAISQSVSALGVTVTALSLSLGNVISNTDPAALDSLTELVAAFQAADSDLNDAITSALGTHTSELAAHATANAASFAAVSTRITDAESDIAAATASISALSSTVSANKLTADTAATNLEGQITSLDTTLRGLITDEANTRASEDSKLDVRVTQNANNISDNETAISNLQNTVSTLQSGTSGDVSALQDEINVVEQSAFGNQTGVYPTTTGTNYIDDVTSLYGAVTTLDGALGDALGEIATSLSEKQGNLSVSAPLALSSNALSIDLSDYVTSANFSSELSSVASSLTSLDGRVDALETSQLTINVSTLSSGALSYTDGTLTLVDAEINAGTAASLASPVDLALSGAVTGTASFSSGGSVTLVTSFAEDMATQTELNNLVTLANGLTAAVSTRVSAIEADYLTSSSTLSSNNLDNASVGIAGLSVDLGGSISAVSLSDALSLDDFVTAASLTSAGFATTGYVDMAVSGLASASDVTDEISAAVSGLASETYVDTQVSNLVAAAPETLNTLNELAAALGDDPNFATSVTAHLGTLSSRITSLDSAKQGVLIASTGIALSGATISTSFDISDYVTAASHSASIATLSSSISDLQDEDTAFASSLSTLESSISSVSLSLSSEVSRAVSAESVLASSITSLVSDLASESTARTSADNTLQANIDTEATTRAAAVSALVADITAATASISTETAARVSADTTLQSNIDEEATTRAAADTALGLRIDHLDTDDVAEGTNLYYTDARARGAISVVDNGGDGSLAYNALTGVLTYQGPSSSDVTQYLNAGTNLTLTGGTFSLSPLLTSIVVSGHVLEAFDHGAVAGVHDSVGDYGNVSSNSVTHAVDLGGLDNGSLF